MKFFNIFQSGLERVMNPFADWISRNKFIQALTQGFMSSMPVTIGTAAIAVLGNLPIAPWQTFLENTGLHQVMLDLVSATISLLAVYIVSAIAYNYTKNEGENGIVGALLAFAAFLVLAPIHYVEENGATLSMLSMSDLGSNGVFPAMICGILIPYLYCLLMKKKSTSKNAKFSSTNGF